MRTKMKLFFTGTLLSRGVKINKLQVPQVIQHGSPVILDCDFTLSSEEKGLVLKWYKNQSLVYQWIPGIVKRIKLSLIKLLILYYVLCRNEDEASRFRSFKRTFKFRP